MPLQIEQKGSKDSQHLKQQQKTLEKSGDRIKANVRARQRSCPAKALVDTDSDILTIAYRVIS
jgi:hypothetical protein